MVDAAGRHLAGTMAAATATNAEELMHRPRPREPRAELPARHGRAGRCDRHGVDRILEASDNKDDQDTNVIRFGRVAEQLDRAVSVGDLDDRVLLRLLEYLEHVRADEVVRHLE